MSKSQMGQAILTRCVCIRVHRFIFLPIHRVRYTLLEFSVEGPVSWLVVRLMFYLPRRR